MKQTRKTVRRLLILLLRLGLNEAVVRLTLRICVGAVCKASAITLVETLFGNHMWTLYAFEMLLDASLLLFCIDICLEMLEELGIPARVWLNRLYEYLMPRSEGKPRAQLPDAAPRQHKDSAAPSVAKERKTGVGKRHKNHPRRRRAAKALPPVVRPADAIPRPNKPPTEPLVIPRRNSDQGLDS